MRKQMASSIGSVLTLASISAMASPALDGVFYPGWGDAGSGTVSTEFVSQTFEYWENITNVVALPDGSAIVVGTVGVEDDIGLVRLTPKGEPDPAFGIDGFATVPDKLWGAALDATLDKNGMLLLAGSREDGPFGNTDFAVCRVDPATGKTVAFAANKEGCVTIEFDEKAGDVRRSQAYNVIALADGGIVLTGNLAQGPTQEESQVIAAMAKLKPDGSLDAGFGTVGKRTFTVQQSLGTDFGKCAGTSNGKIICEVGVLESQDPYAGHAEFLRFNAQGVLEANWSGGANVAFPELPLVFFRGFELVRGAGGGEDDIISLGIAVNPDLVQSQAFATRIVGQSGQIDTHFGTDGFVMIENWWPNPKGFVLQPGIGFIIANTGWNTLLARRFHFDGSIDTSFGKDGSLEIGNPDNENSFSAMRAAGDGLYLVGIHTGVADPQKGFNTQSGPPTPKTKLIAAKLTLDGIFADDYED